jgi:acyl transferase domain-containing protein/surfactin synthase thioesterase subunit
MPEARKAPFAAEWETLPHKGGFLDDVTGFDAGFFGISPREARALDPQHRLLLEVTWEALENGALPPDRLSGARTGLYIGVTGQDYRDWQTGEPDAYWATGNGHCFAAGRIAYTMGFTGPALAVDTACSSGLVAVHLACQAVRNGECEIAVAGGVNLILSPRSTRLVQQTRALSPDGICKTFDARANGFTRSEGCGVVVIKRLDHALRDGDHVHAVIRGTAVNQDGRSSGLTAPNVRAQIALIEAALADAGLAPADIGLVEAHGTGTSLGDPIEMAAIVEALGVKNGGARLHVGSVKTNLGHLEAAAGIAGLLKVVACCARRAIPPLVHFRTLNPRIDLAGTGIAMPTELRAWQPDAGPFAGVSAFGISGTNAHAIVGPADAAGSADAAEPVEARAPAVARGFELAARTPEALRALAGRFRDRLAELPADQYAGFAYTATSGRARHAVRVRVAAADPTAALAALDAIARDAPCAAVTPAGDAAPLDDLPRSVVMLPHYPWQREDHAPALHIAPAPTLAPAPAAAAAPALAPAPRAQPDHDPAAAARAEVRRQVAAVLGHRDPAAVRDDAGLFDLGLDSLMAADLARALASAFGVELAMSQVFEHPTVAGLAASVLARQSAPAAARPARAPRIGFVFSPQGGQYFGMGRELYASEPVFRARLDDCDRILRPLIGVSIVDAMLSGDDRELIHQTRVTQPATVALQLALAELWRSRGVVASAVLGHSMGELAAAIHAGALDLEAGLTLVAHRGRLMQSTAPGAMLGVTAPPAQVAEWLAGTEIDLAAINGPQAVVVSGDKAAIDAFAARLAQAGVTARPLMVALASHSRMMDPIVPALRAAGEPLAFHAPALPIIANLTGRLAEPDDYSADYWARHLREPVRFHDGVQALRALDVDVLVEIGPDRTLINLITAAGLLPAGGGIASLVRGADARTCFLEAIDALRAQGQPGAPIALPAPTVTPAQRPTRRFVRPRPHANPSLRVIAFHHAGGSAGMYCPMASDLPADWELVVLELPGRGKRHAEALLRDVPALVARATEDVRPWLDAPFALFGHSLGGILAAEVARGCQELGAPPVWVGVSGRVAPALQAGTPRLSGLDDATLLSEIAALGAMPDRVADLPELRAHFLRVVRADIAVLDSYQPAADRAVLDCPITAFAGTSDAWAPPATMRLWARETRREFHQHVYAGGHFYFLGPTFARMTRDLVRDIEPHLEQVARRAASS